MSRSKTTKARHLANESDDDDIKQMKEELRTVVDVFGKAMADFKSSLPPPRTRASGTAPPPDAVLKAVKKFLNLDLWLQRTPARAMAVAQGAEWGRLVEDKSGVAVVEAIAAAKRGDKVSKSALHLLISRALVDGSPRPEEFKDYLLQLLSDTVGTGGRRGRSRKDNLARNGAVCRAAHTAMLLGRLKHSQSSKRAGVRLLSWNRSP